MNATKRPTASSLIPPACRRAYQRDYHATHCEEAAERKELERYRREKARTYWRTKILLKREMPLLLKGVSAEIIEQERLAYLALLDEECEVIYTPPDVVRKRNVTTDEEEETDE